MPPQDESVPTWVFNTVVAGLVACILGLARWIVVQTQQNRVDGAARWGEIKAIRESVGTLSKTLGVSLASLKELLRSIAYGNGKPVPKDIDEESGS